MIVTSDQWQQQPKHTIGVQSHAKILAGIVTNMKIIFTIFPIYFYFCRKVFDKPE